MKTFLCVLQYHHIGTREGGDRLMKVDTKRISCDSFIEAAKIALDSEGETWETKGVYRELISIMRIE